MHIARVLPRRIVLGTTFLDFTGSTTQSVFSADDEKSDIAILTDSLLCLDGLSVLGARPHTRLVLRCDAELIETVLLQTPYRVLCLRYIISVGTNPFELSCNQKQRMVKVRYGNFVWNPNGILFDQKLKVNMYERGGLNIST